MNFPIKGYYTESWWGKKIPLHTYYDACVSVIDGGLLRDSDDNVITLYDLYQAYNPETPTGEYMLYAPVKGR